MSAWGGKTRLDQDGYNQYMSRKNEGFWTGPITRFVNGQSEKRYKARTQAEFMDRIFKGGVYFFDPNIENVERDRLLAMIEERHERNGSRDESGAFSWTSKLKEIMDVHYKHHWKERFSGVIPKRWLHWSDALSDLKEVRRSRLLLSKDLVDAGITYHHPAVMEATGVAHRLSIQQLAVLYVNRGYFGSKNKILSRQMELGVSGHDIELARDLAGSVALEHEHSMTQKSDIVLALIDHK